MLKNSCCAVGSISMSDWENHAGCQMTMNNYITTLTTLIVGLHRVGENTGVGKSPTLTARLVWMSKMGCV